MSASSSSVLPFFCFCFFALACSGGNRCWCELLLLHAHPAARKVPNWHGLCDQAVQWVGDAAHPCACWNRLLLGVGLATTTLRLQETPTGRLWKAATTTQLRDGAEATLRLLMLRPRWVEGQQ